MSDKQEAGPMDVGEITFNLKGHIDGGDEVVAVKVSVEFDPDQMPVALALLKRAGWHSFAATVLETLQSEGAV